jgi:hypothetical protein
VLCSITKAGLATLAGTDGLVDESERQRTGRLDQRDLKKLLELLDRIRQEAT